MNELTPSHGRLVRKHEQASLLSISIRCLEQWMARKIVPYIRRTLTAFSKLPFHTIFHEAINVRAKNVDRIVEEAARKGMPTGAEVVRRTATRIPYVIEQMRLVEKVAAEVGLGDKLHLWPDEELLDESVIGTQREPRAFREWLRRYHGRISEWPGQNGPDRYDPYCR